MRTETEMREGADIFVESAEVLKHQRHDDGQHILRLAMPQTARTARPGQFIHLQCSAQLPMRRPYSVLSTSPEEGWVKVLYRVVGAGSRLLSEVKAGMTLNGMGPIGNGFTPHKDYSKPLLLGGGVGIPPLLFLAESAGRPWQRQDITVLFASERPLPFAVCDAGKAVSYTSATATLKQLEGRGIAGRLCSEQSYPGFFQGRIDDLAKAYLQSLDDVALRQVEIFACGPAAMLKAVAQLAKQYQIQCQLCVEEYMACGVGGCAGCTIRVFDGEKQFMKRVCVDGPVFSAESIYP